MKARLARVNELKVLNDGWLNCTRCHLGAEAKHHVLYETNFEQGEQAEVMLVGEGPGASENTLGRPFIGPSGRLLRDVMAVSGLSEKRWVLTNLLACRPRDAEGSDRAPAKPEVVACSPRLVHLFNIYQPRVVVALGREPQRFLPGILVEVLGEQSSLVAAPHPSAIARAGGRQSTGWGRYVQTFLGIVNLLEGLEEMARQGGEDAQ